MSIISGLFTSESVSAGHPDKVADRISDAILDHCLKADQLSRVACETLVTEDRVVVSGEITTKADLGRATLEKVVMKAIEEIGYVYPDLGFCYDKLSIDFYLKVQSPDIAQGVNDALEDRGNGNDSLGAGDQGLMFGYACNETEELMPLPISMAHALLKKAEECFINKTLPWLRPDMKSQVTVRYSCGAPVEIDTIVLALQHTEEVDNAVISKEAHKHIIYPVLREYGFNYTLNCYINSTGRFVNGGPKTDTGLTGRKIIVDTYGGYAPHGGGAFSGKDPTKVDRSASYMARYIAKAIVKTGLAEKCMVQLAYTIGKAKPVSFLVDTFGTEEIPVSDLNKIAEELFDCTPSNIIKSLDLLNVRYTDFSSGGHLGREDKGLYCPWENISEEVQQKLAGEAMKVVEAIAKGGK